MASDYSFTHIKTFAGAPRTLRGRPTPISFDPRGKKFVYCNGRGVFIRDVADPSDCDVYTDHLKETTCAAYSPSGFYICSGDITGKIRIWDTVNKEHILKYEYTVLGGPIKDIVWSDDSKRIALCGEGKDSFAIVINWDTGTSCGTLKGPRKTCNSISIKPTRPYRLVVASEDHSLVFYEGIPFKYKSQFHEHLNFVNCVRFSPDGKMFATGGADGKCYIHDGNTGKLLEELDDDAKSSTHDDMIDNLFEDDYDSFMQNGDATNVSEESIDPTKRIHKGGIYGLAWSPDGNHLMTVSADKTVKIWPIGDNYHTLGNETITFELGTDICDMQVGCAWADTTLISLSLNGDINYLDTNNITRPKRVIKGHSKPIVASCLSEDRRTLFTSSFDGAIYYWDLTSGVANVIEGSGHRSLVNNLCCIGQYIITCGIDETVRFISVDEKKYIDEKVIKMELHPQHIAGEKQGMSVAACTGGFVIIRDEQVVEVQKTKDYLYEPTRVAISTSLGKVALGTDKIKVIIYDIVGDQLEKSLFIRTTGGVTDIQFSPDNQYLAFCTNRKQVKVVSTTNYKTIKINKGSHTVKVNAISWSPDSRHLASCDAVGDVIIWNVEKGDEAAKISVAHGKSVDVTSIQWADNCTLITTGRDDCSIRMWKMSSECDFM